MTGTQLTIAASVLLLVALLALVVGLSRQVRTLSRRVEALRSATTVHPRPDHESAPAPKAPVPRASEFPASLDAADTDISVITALSENTVDRDVTTARIASVTVGGALIKVAALSHGLRRALHEEQRMRVSYTFRKELRRQRKMRRRRVTSTTAGHR